MIRVWELLNSRLLLFDKYMYITIFTLTALPILSVGMSLTQCLVVQVQIKVASSGDQMASTLDYRHGVSISNPLRATHDVCAKIPFCQGFLLSTPGGNPEQDPKQDPEGNGMAGSLTRILT